MTQHIICRSLSVACALVGKGEGGAAAPSKAMLDIRAAAVPSLKFTGNGRMNTQPIIYYCSDIDTVLLQNVIIIDTG